MVCKACGEASYSTEDGDCFEKALDALKNHYTYYKNAFQQSAAESQQLRERNNKLNKALHLLQRDQHPSKRFKSSDDSWLGSISSQEDCVPSDLSVTDDERSGVTNLNVALNSEQLFDTSALSQSKNDISTTSSSEMVRSPCVKESLSRTKARDAILCLKDRNIKNLSRSKSEWHTKERNSPSEKSWAMRFLQPNKTKAPVKKISDGEKKTGDKKLCLSLKKTNPSKIKQSMIDFSKSKDTTVRESDIMEDIIEASPVIVTKSSKSVRSHRSGNNYTNSDIGMTKEAMKNDNSNKSLDDIVFDFSPTKKTDKFQIGNSTKNMNPKKLTYLSDVSTDCTSAPNNNIGISTNKSDSSSVMILTPTSQDIIFLDDSSNIEPEIDTMDLLGDIMKQDNTDCLQRLKKYESKCIQKQQQTKELYTFKKPTKRHQTNENINYLANIKQENATQNNLPKENQVEVIAEQKPSCSKSNRDISTSKLQNPLLSSDEPDTEEDDDFMPKPFLIKQENIEKPCIEKRFNIGCEDCKKLIKFLDGRLTDAQIQEHLGNCKCRNKPDIMRQNTPKDFWNPFILSFQADDPRNEVLIDDRFMDNKS